MFEAIDTLLDTFVESFYDDTDAYPRVLRAYVWKPVLFIKSTHLVQYSMMLTPKVLFEYNLECIRDYFISDKSFLSNDPVIIGIFQLSPQQKNWVDKTYWLRIVQRHWRKKYCDFKTNIHSLDFLKRREVYGVRPKKKLLGLLNIYKSKSEKSSKIRLAS